MIRHLILPAVFLSMCLLGGLIVSQEQAPSSTAYMAVSFADIFH